MAHPTIETLRTDGRDTPIRRQYESLKAQYPSCLLLFQLGDFFESFEDDAKTVARVCGVTLTSREFGKGDRVPLAGVPLTRLDHYLAMLLEAGLHVAVAEQVSPPGSGLVERVVTRVITPGTVCEPGLLREKENNFLVSVVRGRNAAGLAYVDVTTGEFAVTQFEGDDIDSRLRTEIERLGPAELLMPEGQELPYPPIGHYTVCQAWRFAESTARERLCHQFGVLSLEGFGCDHLSLAVRAAGAILSYLEENNRRILPSLVSLRTDTLASGMLLDSYTRRNLELLRNSRTGRIEGSLLAILDRTCTPMGGRLLRRWIGQPLLDLNEIDARLNAVEMFVQRDSLRDQTRSALKRIGDLERQVGRVVQGVASPRELFGLAAALRTVGIVAELVKGLGDEEIDPCPEVIDLIREGVAEPGSGRLIRPGYDERLDALVLTAGQARRRIAELEQVERERTGIKSLKVGYNKVFGYYLEVTRPNLPSVPADYRCKQTLVQAERFITPILKEWEDEILQAEERLEELEQEAFNKLLCQIAAHAPRLRRLASVLARLDVFAALADLARERGYCRPVVNQGSELYLVDGRHPVVEASLPPGTFIPNDCYLAAPDCQVMVLTGPNMAGKSTYLRQVALIALMAQIGSFVPAREARIGLIDRIFTRVGAQDDIAAGASTFMVEMMETANILHHATARSLIILDEIGRGTSTFDGLAIARAVLEEIHQHLGARTLFATHFHELGRWASELTGARVFNVTVAEADGEIVFLRRVVPGAADRSYGIQVARLAGLPVRVTERAAEILQDLEAKDSTAVVSASAERLPLQPPLPNLGSALPTPADLLDELLALDPTTLTPLDALNKLWEIQHRAGRW